MRYTVAIAAERALQALDVKPLYAHYAPERDVNGFSTSTRDRRRTDILWLNDNSGGARPYAACGVRHCIHIASRAEEAAGVPECGEDRSLIVLPHSVQLRRLVAALEQCFAFYNAWSEALLDVLRRGGDWYELAEEGHRVLQNPMVLYNRSMRILAYTVNDGADDALWTDTVREGVARVDSPSRSEDLLRFITEVERRDAPFRFKGEGMSDPFWCAPVRVGGRTRGMVNVVEYHRPLTPGATDLLRFFAEFAAIGMQRQDTAVPVPDAAPRQFMLDLLGGGISSRERLNTRLVALDWAARERFCFVSLRSALPYLSGEQWRSLYGQLSALGLNGLNSLIGDSEPHIALLLTAQAPEQLRRPLEVLEQFCRLNPLRAGVSDVYDDLLQTPRFYRQAESARELERDTFCRYGQARYARMLRHLRRHPYAADLMHPAMARLAALGREEGAEYIPTLQALIRHTFNQVETAQALGIHRTTLAYRLRRVQELTELDLGDPMQVFHLAVSLKMMEGDSDLPRGDKSESQ